MALTQTDANPETKPRSYQEIKRDQFLNLVPDEDPIAFGNAIRILTDADLLMVDPAALATWSAVVAYAAKEGVLATFWTTLQQLVRGTCKTVLYPDGLPDELSFGFAWYAPKAITQVNPLVRFHDRPWIVGGVIYRGPGRKYPNNPYKDHSWTIHT